MINEAHASVSIDDVYIHAAPGGAGYNRGAFGIDFPYILPGAKASEQKIPTVSLPDFLQYCRRAVPVPFFRDHLCGVGQLDQGMGEPHHQGRLLL